METFGRVQRSKCLFHDAALQAALEQILTILEASVHIHELEPCQRCLHNYGHDELVRLHCSINTVYDALRMIQKEFNQLRLASEGA